VHFVGLFLPSLLKMHGTKNKKVNSEFKTILKEVVLICLTVITRHLFGGTEKHDGKSQS